MDTITACACGGTKQLRYTDEHGNPRCHPCYMRRWRKSRKTAGAPMLSACAQEWFDWDAVQRAWEGEPVGRKLTRSEREYLTSKALMTEWTPTSLGRLLGMDPADAALVASDVSNNRVQVPARDWQGKPA